MEKEKTTSEELPALQKRRANDDDDDDDDELPEDIDILTEDEMLLAGMKALKWTDDELSRGSKETNNNRFRGHYGADPHVIAALWVDLQTTSIIKARLDPAKRDINGLFVALHFLKRYPKEIEAETLWKRNPNKNRSDVWYYINLIRELKAEKIGWPSHNFGGDIWVMSVDGTHFRTQEPSHPNLPKDPSYFSYKNKCAGFNYEIGLALPESKLVWFNGPYKAGTYNDIKIFKEMGLKRKLRKYKKRVIADHGYRGQPKYVSTNNSRDSDEVRRFKIRARQRHEKFNGMLKEFECLGVNFRHRPMEAKLQACFEAVVVIVQYKMEMGTPLFEFSSN